MTKYELSKIEAVLTTLYEVGQIGKKAFEEMMKTKPFKKKQS